MPRRPARRRGTSHKSPHTELGRTNRARFVEIRLEIAKSWFPQVVALQESVEETFVKICMQTSGKMPLREVVKHICRMETGVLGAHGHGIRHERS